MIKHGTCSNYRESTQQDPRAQALDVVRCSRGNNMELLQTFRWLKVRYESWEDHVGVLPPYDAPKKRASTKTGDLKSAYGGTPLSSRYHARSHARNGADQLSHAF